MKRLSLTLGLALALFATSSAAAGSAAAQGTGASGTTGASALSGAYKTTISSAGSGPLQAFDGTWTINFKAGKYTWKHSLEPGGPVDGGKYKISGSTITFRDTSATGDSIGCKGSGKYHFKLRGKKLTFTLISDPVNSCYGRQVVLTTAPFTKG